MIKIVKLTLFASALLLIASCMSAPTPTPTAAAHGRVDIDMTSGVMSPSWTLHPTEIEHLEQMLAALPASEMPTLFDGLGYRGFLIHLVSPDRLIRVQNGFVLTEEDGKQAAFADTDHQIERWLLNASQPHIAPELYDVLEASIQE